MQITGKYGVWDIVEKLPEGWRINKMIGAPVCGHVVIDNCKSPLTNQCKRMLLKVERPKPAQPAPPIIEPQPAAVLDTETQLIPNYEFPSHSVNSLARKKFQEHLLKEILFDLTVCELEGWDKLEYIKELKRLINGVAPSNTPKNKLQTQLDFFTQNNL